MFVTVGWTRHEGAAAPETFECEKAVITEEPIKVLLLESPGESIYIMLDSIDYYKVEKVA